MNYSLQEVLTLLPDAKSSGKEWQARCPAHDDTRPSLSIRESETGKVLLHCHAGCKYQDIVTELQALRSTKEPNTPRAHIATYSYTDEAGHVRYQVLRYKPKDFRQRQPDGNGAWLWHLKGVKRVPYRLPALLRAAAAHKTIYYVEGEKDVKSARKIGITATTLAGGAKAPIPDDFAQYFQGARRVVILPDNDKPGQSYARRIAYRLTTAGIPCKILNLPGLTPKEDLTDWLAADGTRERLRSLVKAAPQYIRSEEDACLDRTPPESDNDAADTDASLLTTRLWDVEPETVQWLWPDRIPLGKLVLVEGDPGVSKSFFTLAVAAHVSGGRRLPGMAVEAAADVLMVSYEDGVADTIVPRCVAAGAKRKRIHHVRGVGSARGEDMLTLPDHIPALHATVERTGAKLVIIDPLSAALSGKVDSYKDADIRRVLAQLAHLADATGATVLVVRHLRKASSGSAITAGGGSIGIIGATRAALRIGPAPDESEHGTDARILAVVKSNLAPIPPSLVYRLVRRKNGQARIKWLGETSCTADELAAARDKSKGVSPTQVEEAVDMLRDILASGELKKKDVLTTTRKNDLSDRTVERAAKRLGIIRTRKGQGTEHGIYWSLPTEDLLADLSTLATSATPATSGKRGESGESRQSAPKKKRRSRDANGLSDQEEAA